MKKLLVNTSLALGLLATAFAVPATADAATVTKNSSGKGFSKAWEVSTSGSNWLMKYGFNTSWIDEDYTHTTSSKYAHTATVSNANGAFTDYDSAGYWAEIEVTHSGTYVEYSITY
jgi:hypothetical protein